VERDVRLKWDPAAGTLDDWLEAARPSIESRDAYSWIQVHNKERDSPGFDFEAGTFTAGPYQEALNKISAIIARGGRVPAKEKKACVDSLLETAHQQQHTSGKWMVFLMPGVADAAWANIARATVRGQLGCSAKITPTCGLPATEPVVCCVYVGDFSAAAEVKRVLLALQTLMVEHGVQVRAGFKPDAFTNLEINAGNAWRLPPTIYSVKELLDDEAGR
jgi:hypothetical protein